MVVALTAQDHAIGLLVSVPGVPTRANVPVAVVTCGRLVVLTATLIVVAAVALPPPVIEMPLLYWDVEELQPAALIVEGIVPLDWKYSLTDVLQASAATTNSDILARTV